MQKWARMLMKTGMAFADPSAKTTQMREDSRLTEFAIFNNLVWANTFGRHKAFADPSAMTTQMREDSRLTVFAIFNNLVWANTFGHHKAPRSEEAL